MEIFRFDKKNKLLLAFVVGIGLYVFIMIFATIFYILQWNYLTPEPGSTFEADMIKATLSVKE